MRNELTANSVKPKHINDCGQNNGHAICIRMNTDEIKNMSRIRLRLSLRGYFLTKGFTFPNKIIDWQKLKSIVSTNFFRNTSIWIVLIPIAAKTFSLTEDTLTFNILGEQIKILFRLPFSWKALYFSGIFFLSARILYETRCPKIVKSYSNYVDYKEKGGTTDRLIEHFLETTNLQSFGNEGGLKFSKMEDMKDYYKCVTGKSFRFLDDNDCEFFQNPTGDPPRDCKKIHDLELPKEKRPELFRYTSFRASFYNAIDRAWVMVFLLLGSVCLGYVFIENLIYVVVR